jgi:putative methyltransferase (TIGR04325 family)
VRVGFSVRWTIKAFTPPIVLLAIKRVAIALGLRAPDPPPEPLRPAVEPPEWEYVPEGWARAVPGWDVQAVADAQRRKWPDFLQALSDTGALGVYHETVAGSEMDREDLGAHNNAVTFGYVLGLAARGRDRLEVLDWGGGVGHYHVLARVLQPGLDLVYTCKDVPALVEAGRELQPEVEFTSDDAVFEREFDLVVASSSLQYAEAWADTFAGLGRAARRYLFVTRLPIALESPSFVVLQRAYRYGYDTEYLGWVLNRDELLGAAVASGLTLEREFVVAGRFAAEGAPESPIGHRGFLFRSGR